MLREGRLVGGEVSLLVSVREKPSSCWGAGECGGVAGVRRREAAPCVRQRQSADGAAGDRAKR